MSRKLRATTYLEDVACMMYIFCIMEVNVRGGDESIFTILEHLVFGKAIL